MPDQSAEATLRYVVESGISQIELMNGPAESFAGAPQGGRGGGGRRGEQPTPEQQAAQRESAERLKQWRTSVSMDRFKQLRKMFNDAGVTIYAWKALNPNMPSSRPVCSCAESGALASKQNVTSSATLPSGFNLIVSPSITARRRLNDAEAADQRIRSNTS